MRTKSTFTKLISLALLVSTVTIYTAGVTGAAAGNAPLPTAATTEENQVYICHLYNNLLARTITPVEEALLLTLIANGFTRSEVAQKVIDSPEYRAKLVQKFYQKYLGRAADSNEQNLYGSMLENGETDETVILSIVSQGEYFAKTGATNGAFLDQLFKDLLGRPIDPASLASFLQFLQGGHTRKEVADLLLNSQEYRENLVRNLHEDLLNRPPDSGELSFFETFLENGGTNEQVIALIVASVEYFNKFFSNTQHLIASDGAADDEFATSVAIDGDIIVVGSHRDAVGPNQSQGSAYVFERNQGGADSWGEVKKLTASDGAANDLFGTSVGVSGDTIVVGAGGHKVGANGFQGAAFVFVRDLGGANNWGELKHLAASDGAVSDFFGTSLSISEDTIVVGAESDAVGAESRRGSAYVFERNHGGANNWGEVKHLTASDGAAEEHFGSSVSINGDTVAVGASFDTVGANKQQGSAYVFIRNQGGIDNWGEVKRLTASDGEQNDTFGSAVSISTDTIVVGAPSDDVGANDGQGSAYVFERNHGGANNWGEVKHLIASDGAEDDLFGTSVSISGDTIIVGSPTSEVGQSLNQGKVYVYDRDEGGADNWGEARIMTAFDGEPDDQFGTSVAINGNSIVAGARNDDIGPNEKQGSAYVFACDCTGNPPANNPPQISGSTISRQQGSPALVETIATVSDDSTPAGSLVVAVTSSPAGITVSSITNTNGTITASVEVACSAVPGANQVGLQVTDSNNATATGNLTVNVIAETTPPSITCPANVTAVATPPNATVVVSYLQPVASDNCSVPVVVCNPPSGSAFPIGSTTVVCTATDASNNSATCSFTVSVFDVCLQDDSNPGRVLLFNSQTGDYLFSCSGQIFTGKGKITMKGNICTLTHNPPDRRVLASFDAGMKKGTASLQAPPGSILCTINDKNTLNNTCVIP